MAKHIVYFLSKVILLAIVNGVVAAIIWYFINSKTTVAYSSILFWCGAAAIAIGALLFGGHTDISLAPRDYRTAGAIDPKDMAYGRNLRRLSESALMIMGLAGGLNIAVSLLITEWH